MDKITVEKFENQLRELLAGLEELQLASESATATVVLDQSSVGRLTRMDAMQSQQMAIATEHRRKEHIYQIKAALNRIKANDFGKCLECGEEISVGRLSVNPESNFVLSALNKIRLAIEKN